METVTFGRGDNYTHVNVNIVVLLLWWSLPLCVYAIGVLFKNHSHLALEAIFDRDKNELNVSAEC